ncbi:MAG: D-aminoacyl-tRNA deacylase [Armatimonadota bacterium]
MRAVLQRVSEAAVEADGEIVGRIGRGLVVLVGCGEGDGSDDARALADKIAKLRVFEDLAGKMNLSIADVGGGVLVVPNFTLYGDCRKGRRPSFTEACEPETAARLVAELAEQIRACGVQVECGRFGARMRVSLVNEGPVTLLLSTDRTF